MKIIACCIVAILLAISGKGQIDDSKIRKQVLEKNIVDSLFVFGKWTKSGQTETQLKYLGQVTTTDGRVLKIMNSIWIWGPSQCASSLILIYNNKNQFIGYYSGLIMTSDLPDRLENGKLIFTNYDDDCDKNLITEVDFTKGIPKQIFLKCKGEWGEFITFSSE